MLKEIEQLLILQDRDIQIRARKQEEKMAPLERKELEARLAAAQAKLDEVKLKGKEIEVEKKKLELEAQSKRDSIAKFKTQQFQTRKNEEFQALGNEIKRYEGEIQKIEDREIELMEEAEQVKGFISVAEKEFAASKAQVQQQLSDLEAKIKAIGTQLAEIQAERARLAEQVDEDLLSRYDRLFASKGDRAVVGLEHEVCMGCHMKITTQTSVKVKGGKEVVSCEQCGRILYFSE